MKTILSLAFAAMAAVALPASATSPAASPAPTAQELLVIRAIAAAQVDKNAPRTEPVTIRKYLIDGRGYYYERRRALLRLPNRLYTADGVYLCAPDGGVTGGGDAREKCPHVRLPGQPNWIVWHSPASSAEGQPR